ncbi:type II toxin-antitoxin system PemK/MazF family toxin [Flammeovirgaceae bacterium SG7u.111]|nr:type II toxin-antitoxin system PemK/MazF family toxin [Flammeovirgaceae bacterium SG7u.132]WPO33623.1 type II toxin-antitoxin system PemK/MazF family toxin [Flammeovirgaceae bacterium SG7u.111]
MEVSQYEIVLVNLDPTVGSEIKKTRPCVVISPNEMNKHLKTVVVAPMTTKNKNYPTRVEVKHKNQKGWAAIDQIRTIDKQRIVEVYNSLSPKEINQTKAVIRETFVD